MFDEILQMVKDHMAENPQVAAAIPAGQEEAVHTEIANQIQNVSQSGGGGLMSSLGSALTSGGAMTGGIEGAIISTLTSKLGLPPEATGAIAGALPGLIAKYTQKQATDATGGTASSGLGSVLGGLF